jgi:hypothetical protein
MAFRPSAGLRASSHSRVITLKVTVATLTHPLIVCGEYVPSCVGLSSVARPFMRIVPT